MYIAGQIVRYVVIFSSFICVCEVIAFLIAYYKTIIPMKVALGDKLIAPPIWWVFWYHLLVGLAVLLVATGIIVNMHRGFPVNPVTFAMAVVIPALTVVIKKFMVHYIRILRASRRESA